MDDIKEYLPKSRKLYRAFINAKLKDIQETNTHSRVGPGTGYGNYHRSSEVRQHIFDITANLEESFGYVRIPTEFSSPKQLAETWQRFYDFLIEKEELFEDVYDKNKEDPEAIPDPYYWIRGDHKDVLALFEEIVNMDEVQELLHSTKSTKDLTPTKEFDIVIITALFNTEFEAVKSLPIQYSQYLLPDDPTDYFTCVIGTKKILIATDDKMGIAASASLATKLIAKFSPEYLIMSGIAAGVKDDEKSYGDILICRSTWNYESGKYKYKRDIKQTVFEPSPEQIEIHSALVPKINTLSTDINLLQTIKDNFDEDANNKKTNKPLKAFFGPMATGSAVVADEKKVNEIKKNNRKLIGIDMETFGIYYAARNFRTDYQTKVVSIKSISDFADQRKNDKYRKYAAYTSAKFVHELIKNYLQ